MTGYRDNNFTNFFWENPRFRPRHTLVARKREPPLKTERGRLGRLSPELAEHLAEACESHRQPLTLLLHNISI